MVFGNLYNKVKNTFGVIKDGYNRFGKVVSFIKDFAPLAGKVLYNTGRGIYDYTTGNDFKSDNYYNMVIPEQAPIRKIPIKAPRLDNHKKMPPPSRQHEKKPDLILDDDNLGQFWKN